MTTELSKDARTRTVVAVTGLLFALLAFGHVPSPGADPAGGSHPRQPAAYHHVDHVVLGAVAPRPAIGAPSGLRPSAAAGLGALGVATVALAFLWLVASAAQRPRPLMGLAWRPRVRAPPSERLV